jgi:DNA polymerase-3 subunit epsilon
LGTYVIDSFRIFSTLEQRNLKSAVRFYCGEELVGAHSALADSQAALKVLLEQVRRRL